MGIKGIYNEIGPGERLSLTKLAIDKFEETGRPLRIAIDVSIWQFQIQAGRGGSDPATRTLYYRLQRLLAHSIQPLFVFDGPHKPPVKRNKRTGGGGGSVSNLLTKKLLNLFGFPYHMAPGEAEAECALLQREGIVDAVLSEDVDTLMFGSTLTLRNWTSEGAKGNKSPTHVNVYDSKATKDGKSGLDREGMILVALMSGGDYDTDGIPGCGIKVACEAARAGFGRSLCRIPRADTAAYQNWRNELADELTSNKSKYFRTKHKTLNIPEDFPNREILGYYTHPIVSTASKVQQLKEGINWDIPVDISGLRAFVAEAFEWNYKTGCRKFIRGIAPALLVQKLRLRANRRDSDYGDLLLVEMNELELVRSICGNRKHFDTGATPELRLIFIPIEIVGLNLDEEEDSPDIEYGRDGLAPRNDDDEIEEYMSDADTSRSTSPTKRAASIYDPTQPDKVWVSHTIAKFGVPLKVEDYEESLRNPRKFLKAKAAGKKAASKSGMQKGAIDRFVRITKPVQNEKPIPSIAPSKTSSSNQSESPPVFLAPTLDKPLATGSASSRTVNPTRGVRISGRSGRDLMPIKPARPKGNTTTKPRPNTNPWDTTRPLSSVKETVRITKPNTTHTNSNPTPLPLVSKQPLPANQLPISESNFSKKHAHSHSFSSNPSKENDHELSLPVRLTRGSKASILNQTTHQTTPSKSIGNQQRPRKRISPNRSPHIHSEPPSPSSSPPPTLGLTGRQSTTPTPRSPSPIRTREKEIITLDSSPIPATKIPTKVLIVEEEVNRKKKYIIPRESLPGAFKIIEEGETPAKGKGDVRGGRGNDGGRWRMSQVELLDLSGD